MIPPGGEWTSSQVGKTGPVLELLACIVAFVTDGGRQ